ncbi:MAG: metallophosphoesterase [Chloroflexi bacterium]|nr:metallophosphoesterase [Chloroflexota bacterium]MCC6896463.1 metallophosphoesterase [Anaerolineae bacterium]
MSRIVDLNSGTAMIITDLHGAWDAYQRLRDQFLQLLEKGEANHIIICGDLIHNEGMEEVDASLDMLLDVMALQADLGKEKVTMLLGNHELPHIYGLTLAKGSVEFTPRFESALTRLDQRYKLPIKRKEVRAFLASLPFFARTKGGVLITHAGAASDVTSTKHVERLLSLDHNDLISLADRELKKFDIGSLQRGYSHFTGISYDEQAKHYLAINGADDPRYNELLRVLFLSGQNTDFDLMWNTLFSQNELDVGESAYLKTLKNFLSYFSAVSPNELRVLVSGHISVKDGYAEIGKQQLRMASCTHAFPRKTARYLLLDCAKTVNSSEDLIPGLRYVFEEGEVPTPAPSVAAVKSA